MESYITRSNVTNDSGVFTINHENKDIVSSSECVHSYFSLEITFGGNVTAATGNTGFAMSECVFGEDEQIHTVHVDDKLLFYTGRAFPTSLTFVTTEKTCGPFQPTGGFTGTRLLLVNGRSGNRFDQIDLCLLGVNWSRKNTI